MPYNVGDSVRFDCSWQYQGPSYSGAKLRCSVGNRGSFGFDEICHTEVGITMDSAMSWDTFTQRVIVVLKNVAMGLSYDVEVKLTPNSWGLPNLYWKDDGVIVMGTAAPEKGFQNLHVVLS